MAIERRRMPTCLGFLALLVAVGGANLAKNDCSSALPSCQSEEDYSRCRDQRPTAEQSPTACYCSEGLPRSCANLCGSSIGEHSGAECRRRCSAYAACLDAQAAVAPPADILVNGPSPPLHSKFTARKSDISVGWQTPSAERLSPTHADSGSRARSPFRRDGDMNAFALHIVQQWWGLGILVLVFLVLIVYGIVKMRYCHDDSVRDTGQHPPTATCRARGTSGDFPYRLITA